MFTIDTMGALSRALDSPIDVGVKRLLALRCSQLGTIEDAARFIVVEPGDTAAATEKALGFPITEEGEPCFDWALHHEGLFELTFILSDEGAADVLLVSDNDDIDANLLALCRLHAIAATAS